jgi:hypothetical protein
VRICAGRHLAHRIEGLDINRLGAEMERELWSREDLRNAILSTYYAGIAAQPAVDSTRGRAYADGFRAALSALALQFGLPSLEPPAREAQPGFQLTWDDEETRIIGD